jgi:hypothetical protein
VAAEWDAACRQVGFLKVVDHGVPAGVIDRAWNAVTEFFRLPLSEKASVAMTSDYPYGYQAMGTENLEASLDKGAEANPGDAKEMFNVCVGSVSGGAGVAPVRWPAGYPSSSRAALEEYYSELEALSSRLYDVCALALGLPEGWFAPRTGNHRNVIRAIHYPAQQTPPAPGQERFFPLKPRLRWCSPHRTGPRWALSQFPRPITTPKPWPMNLVWPHTCSGARINPHRLRLPHNSASRGFIPQWAAGHGFARWLDRRGRRAKGGRVCH